MLVYNVAEQKDYDVLDLALNSDKCEELRSYHLRYSIVMVKNEDPKSGIVLPVYKTLPYKIKINNVKDRILKNKDIDITIDEQYWNNCSEEEKEILIISALSQLIVVVKKDFPVFNEDGVVKLRLKKPDMIFIGFSDIAEEYGSASPEKKLWKEFLNDFEECLR